MGRQPRLGRTGYWNRVLRHRFAILGLSVLCGLLAALVANALDPLYEAEVTLLLDPHDGGFGPSQDRGGGGWIAPSTSPSTLQTQILLIRSRAMAESVATRLGLWEDPEFDPRQAKPHQLPLQLDWAPWVPDLFSRTTSVPPPTETQARAAVVAAVGSRLRAEAIPNSRVIRLSFTAHDPALAARAANAFADTYVKMGLETGPQRVGKTEAAARDHQGDLPKRALSSAGQFQPRQASSRLAEDDSVPDLNGNWVQALLQRLAEARTRRDALQELHDQMQRAGAASTVELITHPTLVPNITLQSLKASERQADREVTELAKRYGPLHPRMIAARSDLDAARSMLAAEIHSAVASVRRDLESARAQADKLELELNAIQTTTQDTGRGESDPTPLAQEAATERQLDAPLAPQFKDMAPDTGVDTGVDTGGGWIRARVIDAALVPSSPVGPKAAAIIGAAALLGLAAGLVVAMLSAFFDATFQRPQDVEDDLRLPLLGTVPLLSRHRRKNTPLDRLFANQPASPFAEAIRTLRTRVLLSRGDPPHGVVLVTSSSRGEGKTTVATNLALALGQLGEVLLIDADMRHVPAVTSLGLSCDAKGLSELFEGTADESACIHPVRGANIDMLPTGAVPPDPLQIISSGKFAQTLDRLRKRYAWVVIDSPAAPAVSDAVMLSRASDAVVLVIRANQTPRPQIQAAVKPLRQVGAPLIGVVLNACAPGHTVDRSLPLA
jgi:succinoglycan biosynthesis transport protein ExoP